MSALHFDAVGQMQPVNPNGSLFINEVDLTSRRNYERATR